MATPSLRRDLRLPLLPPPAPAAFASAPSPRLQPMRQHWRVAAAAGPDRFASDPRTLLPRIASLLSGAREPKRPDEREAPTDSRKRKLPEELRDVRERTPRAAALASAAAAASSAGLQLYAPSGRSDSPLRMEVPGRLASFSQQQQQARVRRRLAAPPSSAPSDWEPVGRYADLAASAMRRAMYREFGPRRAVAAREAQAEAVSSPPSESRGRVRPTSAEISSRYVQQQPRDPPRGRVNPSERRRLYYHHSIDPHKIHEIHVPAEIPEMTTHYRDEQPSRKHRTSSRYLQHQHHQQHEVSPPRGRPAYYDRAEAAEMTMTAQKRRRLSPSATSTAQLRQPLYEPEYGLAVLETSKPLVRSRYVASREPAVERSAAASRRRYIRDGSNDFEDVDSPLSASSRISYSGNEALVRTSIAETSAPPAPRSLVNVGAEKAEHTPLTTLVLKSKEFLKSKSLVRNRHDEIDWVATFLKVGFDSSSIYALMCPLRKGRWKSEEEKYTLGLLQLIENGTILLRHGQSIRGYIGEKLHSDDMRVLKKLSNCKMFHFAKLINPRLAEEEKLDMTVAGAREGMERLDQLKGEFLRSVQLEALVAVRKYLSDSSLRDLLNVRA
ncbi:DNA polymerase delta catalytic subunit [Phytophthora cinnamomi]|uniref:DNA polymerase delta catalytic subunit n=1 Tax=Phytophthora cinnamomi TaxID=4785 RepID=UPI003559BF9A|nr:DNA polymerase delta catalytic subunit [Phytophthora cinnamomi]